MTSAPRPHASTGDDPLPPEDMLALLNHQRRSIEGQMAAFVPVILLAWGIAWFVGFGALWLIDGARPVFSLPAPAAVATFVVLLAGAIAVSAVLGIRSGRGVRASRAETFQGVVYGLSWTIGSLAIFGFAQGLFFNGMDAALANIFFPVAFVLFAGVMYVLSAAMWHAVPMLILGIWIIVVGVAAPFFGYPAHYLVLSLGGGLAFLALGVVSFVRLGRLRRAADPGRRQGVRRG